MNDIKVAIWVGIGVLHLPTLAMPWLYWRRRQYDPVRSRRPALFTQCLAVCVAFIWQQIVRNAFGWALGVWFDYVVGSLILLVVYESFFVFALSLYVAYNKTREQMAIYQTLATPQATPADVDSFMRSLRWSSFLLSNRFAFGWVWGSTAAWMAVLVAYAQPATLWTIPLDAIDTGRTPNPFPLYTLLVLGRNLVTIACLIVTSLRLRIVQDAFGTKALLKRVGLFTTCTTLFYLLTQRLISQMSPLGIQYMINMLAADYVVAVAFVMPWLRARGSVKMLTVAEGSMIVQAEHRAAQSDFELFLRTADGFAAFKAHLEKEFSVENLLFWGEVMKFRTDPTEDHAWAIFDKFLSATAPLEVNLPSASLRKFREQIFKDRHALDLQTEMFDDSADQLVRLMEVNSLQRFLKTSPPSWSKFMELREEQKAMEHAGELRSTTSMRGTTVVPHLPNLESGAHARLLSPRHRSSLDGPSLSME